VEVPAPKTLERATVPAEGTRQPGARKAAPAAGRTAARKDPAVKKAATRKTAKKAPPSALVVKEGEDPWTKGELDSVLHELHAHRARLVDMMEVQEVELNGLMRDAGDGAGQDQADMGATSFERDHELTLMNSERVMLAQIDKALTRIADGTYGMCESCGQAIGKMRVMAFPRATLCLPCKQREERR